MVETDLSNALLNGLISLHNLFNVFVRQHGQSRVHQKLFLHAYNKINRQME